jgi:hypothetical protein
MTYEEFEKKIIEQRKSVHCWGDDWPHWNELYAAGDWIERYVYKHSLCKLHWKEKWGQLRYERILPPAYKNNGPIVKLPFPLFYKTIAGKKFPRYLIYWTASKLYYMWMRLGERALKKAVKKASKKFPNVVKEIRANINDN